MAAGMGARGTEEVMVVTDRRWRTELSVHLRASDLDRAMVASWARNVLAEEADRMELAASRFRADSQLSAVNAAAGQWVHISAYLADLVSIALDAARQTAGLTNPVLGLAVDRAGYRGWEAGRLTPELVLGDPTDVLAAWQKVELRPHGSGYLIRIPADTALDLGATAKGWLADEVAGRLSSELEVPVLANMGGDLFGTGSWDVAVDPELPGVPAHQIVITDAGLATSSRARRSWLTASGSAHHIIDARTGLPAQTQWWSVSVLAATATAANIASTAAMVMDDAAPAWLAGHALDAWLVSNCPGQPIRSVRTCNWPTTAANPQPDAEVA